MNSGANTFVGGDPPQHTKPPPQERKDTSQTYRCQNDPLIQSIGLPPAPGQKLGVPTVLLVRGTQNKSAYYFDSLTNSMI